MVESVGATEELPSITNQPTHQPLRCNCNDNTDTDRQTHLMKQPLTLIQHLHSNTYQTRMWANAQPDGRPAKRRWRPLFNAAKFG